MSDDRSSDDLLREISLPRSWVARWAERPDAAALKEAGGRWLDGAGLAAASAEAASGLWRAGVRRGDRVLMSASASLALVAAHVGALRLGAIVVPANPAYTQRELDHVVADASPTLALSDDAGTRDRLARAPGAHVVCDVDLEARAVLSGEPELDAAGSDDPALIGYTSGTTGRPKGALLSHGNLLAGAESLRSAWRWRHDDRLALALPLFHMHGLGVGLHGTFHAGASAVLLERFDVDALLDVIQRDACTLLFGVPTTYQRLVASSRRGELSALRLCVSGSAPLPPELFDAIGEAAGSAVLERYGMTETVMLTSNPLDGERRKGTVGLPLPGVELRLADEEAKPSEVLVRGPNVFAGYWGDPGATAAAFDGGWFRTGDVGELDEAGYLRLVGRSKELIISGGFNVYPREVEEVLAGHPRVSEVAVAGVPSEEWGEAVTAFVAVGDDADLHELEAALVELATQQLAPYKRPKAYRFVDSLPRNALGKVQRGKLL